MKKVITKIKSSFVKKMIYIEQFERGGRLKSLKLPKP